MIVILEGIPCSMKYASSADKVDVCADAYSNGRLALQVVDTFGGDPIATITCNLPNNFLNPNEVYIKDYSENEGAFQFAVESKIIESEPKGTVQAGFVLVHRYKMTDEFIALLEKNGIKLQIT